VPYLSASEVMIHEEALYQVYVLEPRVALEVPLEPLYDVLCSSRDYGGVRIHYADESSMSLAEWWNPWSRAMPYVTLTHHLLAYMPHENETVTFNADELAESLVTAVDTVLKQQQGGAGTEAEPGAEPESGDAANQLASILDDTPITVNSYLGLHSVVFNHSKLGYYLERGGYSF